MSGPKQFATEYIKIGAAVRIYDGDTQAMAEWVADEGWWVDSRDRFCLNGGDVRVAPGDALVKVTSGAHVVGWQHVGAAELEQYRVTAAVAMAAKIDLDEVPDA